MKCPNCKLEDLRAACWVPHAEGAFVIFECDGCHEVFRIQAPRKTSGEFFKPIVAKVTDSETDTPPITLRSRRRSTA